MTIDPLTHEQTSKLETSIHQPANWWFGLVVLWFGGLVVWWFGGLVVWWFGGLVVRG